jgi:hypothetical protein
MKCGPAVDECRDSLGRCQVLNACHVGRGLSSAAVKVLKSRGIHSRFQLRRVLISMLQKIRFVFACPLLVIGIVIVLLGGILLARDDRREFDQHYFGPPEKRS